MFVCLFVCLFERGSTIGKTQRCRGGTSSHHYNLNPHCCILMSTKSSCTHSWLLQAGDWEAENAISIIPKKVEGWALPVMPGKKNSQVMQVFLYSFNKDSLEKKMFCVILEC